MLGLFVVCFVERSESNPLGETGRVERVRPTLNTLASKRSFPETSSLFSLFNELNSPSNPRKSGIPAWTDIPAPVHENPMGSDNNDDDNDEI